MYINLIQLHNSEFSKRVYNVLLHVTWIVSLTTYIGVEILYYLIWKIVKKEEKLYKITVRDKIKNGIEE